MRKEFLIASILALGMGISQAQTGTMPAPMQGGMQSPSRPDAGQVQPGTPPPPAGSMGAASAMGSQNPAPQSFSGCLTRTSNGWSLATDQGNAVNVNGTDNQLSQFSNQQVNIQGVKAEDGSISVSSINKVSDSCSNNTQAGTTAAGQTSAAEPSSAGAASGESNAVTNSQTQSSTTSQTTPPVAERPGVVPSNTTKTGEMNPPPGTPAVTGETAPTTVGSGATSDQAASPNSAAGAQSTTSDQNANQNPPASATDQSTATQNPPASATDQSTATQNPPASATDQSTTSQNPPSAADQSSMSSQNNAATSDQTNSSQTTPGATTSNNDQSAGVGQSGANSNQNAGQGAATSTNQNGVASTTDQNGVRHITDLPQNGQQASRLPQTASPLPLLGLLGIGSLGAGLLSRRKK